MAATQAPRERRGPTGRFDWPGLQDRHGPTVLTGADAHAGGDGAQARAWEGSPSILHHEENLRAELRPIWSPGQTTATTTAAENGGCGGYGELANERGRDDVQEGGELTRMQRRRRRGRRSGVATATVRRSFGRPAGRRARRARFLTSQLDSLREVD